MTDYVFTGEANEEREIIEEYHSRFVADTLCYFKWLTNPPDKNKEYYSFIALSTYETDYLIKELLYIKRAMKDVSKLEFLDVGCGIGNILTLANTAGFWASGIEIDKKSAKFAEKIGLKVTLIDALEYTHYDKFDVIYYYCPIADRELQAQLEQKIEKEMKVGAYLIPFLKQDFSLEKSDKFKTLCLNESEHRFFQKIKA